MDRPNLALHVLPVNGLARKLVTVQALLDDFDGCGIIYCATREHTELAAAYLRQAGLDAVAYHAGFDPEHKRRVQQAFLQGGHRAIVATNALGMGIDKPDIRFVMHVDVPGSITAYYQEVGRAGRDGLPAAGVLLFDEADRRIQDHFIHAAQPTPKDFAKILQGLDPDDTGMWPSLNLLKVRSGLYPTRVTVIVAELVEQGLIAKRLQERKQVYVRTDAQQQPDLSRYERQHQVRGRELEAMLSYGRGEVACAMQALRQALGDTEATPCGHCGHCDP